MSVSIALATYNGEKYIEEQLESLYSQTYCIDEVIICDDCSNDDTVQIIKQFIYKNNLEKTWTLYLNEENQGYAGNFYGAMKKCSGEYIFFCDQDDIWDVRKVEYMIAIMEKNSNIQMLACDYESYKCTEDAPSLSETMLKRMKNDNSIEQVYFNRHTIFIGSEGCAMCIRKSFFEEIEFLWFSGWAHDEFIWKLALCKNGCYLYHKVLFKRRLHSNNVSKQKMHSMEKRVDFLEKLYRSHKQTYEFAKLQHLDNGTLRMIEKNQKSILLRLELLKKRKIQNIIPLLIKYIPYYSSKKSILVELVMAIKGKF